MKDMLPLIDPLSAPPKSAFLAEVVSALAKRRKAIRHKVRNIAVEKLVERSNGYEGEKIEVELSVAGQTFRLQIWEDRWAFVDARRPDKRAGWAWEFTRQGRLVGAVDARAVVELLERSIEAATLQSSAALESVWTPLLATGPRSVS